MEQYISYRFPPLFSWIVSRNLEINWALYVVYCITQSERSQKHAIKMPIYRDSRPQKTENVSYRTDSVINYSYLLWGFDYRLK
jgi:hypothetical protein